MQKCEGNEFHAVFETLDGFSAVFDPATKAYYYGALAPDGDLKAAVGWATIVDLTSASRLRATLTAAPGPDFNRFYRYGKLGVATEYFLIENRQKTGRDTVLPAAGVAIWHVDELGSHDNQSLIPNTSFLVGGDPSLDEALDGAVLPCTGGGQASWVGQMRPLKPVLPPAGRPTDPPVPRRHRPGTGTAVWCRIGICRSAWR